MVQRTRPFQIGALTDSWGPTPYIAGVRNGLVALGYREDQQFVMGVRFTQGDLAALPAAAREHDPHPDSVCWCRRPLGLDLIESFARPV